MKKLWILAVLLWSCESDNPRPIGGLDIVANVPTISDDLLVYSYEVYGLNFSDTILVNLNHEPATADLSVHIANYLNGTLHLVIEDSLSNNLFEQVFDRSIVITEPLTGKPAMMKIAFANFTGQVQFAVRSE